jgi:hypothetical protein
MNTWFGMSNHCKFVVGPFLCILWSQKLQRLNLHLFSWKVLIVSHGLSLEIYNHLHFKRIKSTKDDGAEVYRDFSRCFRTFVLIHIRKRDWVGLLKAVRETQNRILQLLNRRDVAEILPKRRKTLTNQSINQIKELHSLRKIYINRKKATRWLKCDALLSHVDRFDVGEISRYDFFFKN